MTPGVIKFFEHENDQEPLPGRPADGSWIIFREVLIIRTS